MKQKGSNNRKNQRLKIAKIHERIKNIRDDFQHKWSIKLVRENQAICIETLNIKGLLKNKYLATYIRCKLVFIHRKIEIQSRMVR